MSRGLVVSAGTVPVGSPDRRTDADGSVRPCDIDYAVCGFGSKTSTPPSKGLQELGGRPLDRAAGRAPAAADVPASAIPTVCVGILEDDPVAAVQPARAPRLPGGNAVR